MKGGKMKKSSIMLIVIAAVIMSGFLLSEEFTYVGAAKCKICHKTEKRGNQIKIWQETKHSQSFEYLKTEEALAAAKKRALEVHPTEATDCLKCHGPLHEKAPELKTEGVTCEVCHGPGSAYKSLKVMKDREEAVKKGLIVYGTPEARKKLCLTCHTSEEFDFAASWEKIKHPVPAQQ
jgi:hypothetical protein